MQTAAPLAHSHPGIILRDNVLPVLKRRGVTPSVLAAQLHMSRQNLHRLLSGTQAVTPPIALRLSRLVTGDPRHAEMWMRLQARHDLAQAEAELADELEATPILVEASAPMFEEPDATPAAASEPALQAA